MKRGLVSKFNASETYILQESPEYVRTSFAAAVTLGLTPGKFFRDAKLHCLNFLLTYSDGCIGRCAYCGLSRARNTSEPWKEHSFIRVDWPTVKMDEIIERMQLDICSHVERVCISMVTHRRAPDDTLSIVRRLRVKTNAVSALITPTIIDKKWLLEAKEAGIDRLGIAIDAATLQIFNKFRGPGVSGPHKWEKYWKTVEEAVSVFGGYHVGIHFIVGLGETEEQMIDTIQRAHSMGALTHLFSFFPEEGSLMHQHKQPPIGQYRRVQLARYLINKDLTSADKMKFDNVGRLVNFNIDKSVLDKAIDVGLPFMTTGCSTQNMENACNRPYSDSTPYQALVGELRNFPFPPDRPDVDIIKKQIWDYSNTSTKVWVEDLDCRDCLSAV